MPATRRGFTLIELMIGMIILAIIGATLTKMLISQTRFIDRQTAQRSARTTARVSQNIMLSELRMVEVGGGIITATPTSLTVRVPFAMGISCGTTGAVTTVALLPSDQNMYANAAISGYAWRATTGVWTYVVAGLSVAGGNAATCTAAQVAVLPGGSLMALGPALPVGAPSGTPVMLFQGIGYEFKASVAQPGTTALWRTLMGNGATEEIAGPFAATAGFGYYVGAATTPQATAPAQLNTIRGVQLRLHGNSERAPQGTSAPLTELLATSVFFKNRLD